MVFILVRDTDQDPDQWIAVKVANTAAQIKAMPCYTRKNIAVLSKEDHPGQFVEAIRIANCATPEIKEGASINELT
jgi:hypothetical protein